MRDNILKKEAFQNLFVHFYGADIAKPQIVNLTYSSSGSVIREFRL